eukprot:TRINITY_DN275_c0_g1_i1.p1 TRINITY_DN275_c0_g1~~TRINITY_DN275_c0_g1_i1.p1  ORF type:complete len:393 (+),score=80.38 TRINITY_DN275_c0_g1_i1:60-1238(+)
MNLVHNQYYQDTFLDSYASYFNEDGESVLDNYQTPVLESYVDSQEKFFRVDVKDEIRKNCLWGVNFLFSNTLMQTCPINRVTVVKKEEDLMKIGAGQRSDYFLVLKVRSKLIVPLKEYPLERAATYESSLNLKVREGAASMDVKFTQRPRSLFHKHSDVMIIVATLYCGTKKLFYDTQELVFRGGTGSQHSASAGRKNTIKTEIVDNLLYNNVYQSPSPQQQPVYAYPQTQQSVNYPQPPSIPQYESQFMVMSNTYTGYVPHQQQMFSAQNNVNLQQQQNPVSYPVTEVVDVNDFYSDFLEMQGSFLLPEYDAQFSETNGISVKPELQVEIKQEVEDSPQLSMSVNSVSFINNDQCQGTIQGTFQNLPFTLSFTANIINSQLEGKFAGTFNQ